MKTVLILTKCVFAESELKKKIEVLGYEVLASSSAIDLIIHKEKFILKNFFEIVIFSESLTNQMVTHLLGNIDQPTIRFYRVKDEESVENEVFHFESALSGYLNTSMSLSSLREELASKEEVKAHSKEVSSYIDANWERRHTQRFIKSLSKKERQVFSILYQSDGNYLKREELAGSLWDKNVTASNLAQLSQIVTRIKRKLQMITDDEDCITTNWRKGYALSKELCEKFANLEKTVIH
ncbi:winged helix-turn-helix domain-containing protein [Enterococcus sp. LJL120]